MKQYNDNNMYSCSCEVSSRWANRRPLFKVSF